MKRILLLLNIFLFVFSNLISNAQDISTIAGNGTSGYSGDGGPAIRALLNGVNRLTIDNAGNIYVTDHLNNAVRMINTAGNISTIAGNGTAGYTGDGGMASAALCNGPNNIVTDNAGNIYFIDSYNHAVRRINPAGIITTIAGDGVAGFSGDGGPAVAARLSRPTGICIDNAGNILVADSHNHAIRMINTAGIISTVAGNNSIGYSGDGGPAVLAQLRYPAAVKTDNAGNIYITDAHNNVLRLINAAGIISTIAGNGTAGYSGDGGPAVSARLTAPADLLLDNTGNLYIADCQNHVIRMINAAGIITTVAGTGTAGYSGNGGPATVAQLNFPSGISFDNAGDLYIADAGNHVVRKVILCRNTVPSSIGISASVANICKGDPVTFTATPVNGGNTPAYQWKVNGNPAGTNNAAFTSNTLSDGDMVSCEMTSSIACTVPVSSNDITIKVNPLPVVTLEKEVTILPGNSVRLTPVITGAVQQYQWTPASGLSNPAAPHPVAAPLNSTTYRLQVISVDGCEASGEITVIVYKKLVMPNAFSPGADSRNDIFRIPPGTTFELKELSVYNRWGGIVFKTKDIHQGWDGRIKGIPASSGLYVYTISGIDQNRLVLVKGTIHLLR